MDLKFGWKCWPNKKEKGKKYNVKIISHFIQY